MRRMMLGAALLLAAAFLPGCEDKEARRKSDDQIVALRRERDEFQSQLDRTRADLRETRAQLHEKYGNALTLAERDRDGHAEQLDRIAEQLRAMLAVLDKSAAESAAGRDRSGLADLARNAAGKVKGLRAEYDSLLGKLAGLEEENKSLLESLRARRPASSAAPTQPDVFRSLP